MSTFATTLIAWQRQHGRHDLPWQNTRDPYRVWLSEIMLQQTQVDTVIPYYQRFLARFPDVGALAAAPAEEVLALWSGLGYYARARNLHRAAQMVSQSPTGRFPRRAADLASLPGIGRSTAAAIASFCFGERVAILDGNVKRVLCRHFGIEGFPGDRAVEQALWALAESLLPEQAIEVYPQALMDMGATICRRSKPLCLHCPLNESCVARATGRQAELPQPRVRKAIPSRSLAVLWIECQGAVLLEQRPDSGIWGGLYSLPELAEGESATAGALRRFALAQEAFVAQPAVRHAFTHFTLTITPWRTQIAAHPPAVHDFNLRWVAYGELETVGLPAPIRKILATGGAG